MNDKRSFDAWGVIRSGATTGDPKGRYPDSLSLISLALLGGISAILGSDCGSLGHKQDDESGLVYVRARYYEPTSGRFISQDPKGSGENWYIGFCDSPTTRIDSSGKMDCEDSLQFRIWFQDCLNLFFDVREGNSMATAVILQQMAMRMQWLVRFSRPFAGDEIAAGAATDFDGDSPGEIEMGLGVKDLALATSEVDSLGQIRLMIEMLEDLNY